MIRKKLKGETRIGEIKIPENVRVEIRERERERESKQ